MSETTAPKGLEMLRKVDAILSAFETHGELTVSQLAVAVDEPTSSLYRLLTGLTETGWLEHSNARGRYRLGLELMRIGDSVEDRVDVREHARPVMEQLNQETGLTLYLCVHRFSRSVCIERFEGRDVRSLATLVGSSTPLFAGGAPRVLFAALPPAEQDRIARSGFRRDPYDPEPPPPEVILADLAKVARQGYAVSDEDVTPGVAAIGSPVRDHRGDVIAAMSVSGLRDAVLADVDALTASICAGAERVSTALGYRPEARDGR